MKHNLDTLKAALSKVPAIPIKARLTRRVEYQGFSHNHPPDWLYTSGKAKRYNPAGVHCVYFGADVTVTRTEFDEMWRGAAWEGQPSVEFNADVKLRRVLDLMSSASLKALKIDPADLFKNWRRAKTATLTQLLGQAVNETRLFSAIRFPSQAAAKRGKVGINFVIFKQCIQAPDFVKILGPTKKPLEQWP